MVTKKTCISTFSLIVLLTAAVQADDDGIRYGGTPGGANRWVYVHENLGPMPEPQPAGELFAATWGAMSGAVDAVGKTFGAVYASIFSTGEGASQVIPLAAPEAKRHPELKYRYWPRFHGMVARWTVSVEE